MFSFTLYIMCLVLATDGVEFQGLQCLISGGTSVCVEYCVAPDYPLFFSVALTFSTN